MKVVIADDKIQIDVRDLLGNIGLSESAEELVNHLGCQDAVIKMVADQIINGITEEGWHGAITFGPEPGTPLSRAQREVAEASSDIAKREIERLSNLCKRKSEENDKLWEQKRDLEETVRLQRAEIIRLQER